jgi:hypothetical protein
MTEKMLGPGLNPAISLVLNFQLSFLIIKVPKFDESLGP